MTPGSSATPEEMEQALEDYTRAIEEIAEMLEARKKEIIQKEKLLTEIESTLHEAERKLEGKSGELVSKEDELLKTNKLLAKKHEDMALQEEELQTNAALQYLSYSMRDEEISRKMEDLELMEREHVDAAKMLEIEGRMKEQNKELEELERRLAMEMKRKAEGGAPAGDGEIDPAAMAKLESLKADIAKREEEMIKREEALLENERNLSKAGTQEEKVQAHMQALRDLEERLQKKDQEIKEAEQENSGFKEVLEDIERKLAEKEAAIKIKEDELDMRAEELIRTGGGGIDVATQEQIEQEVEYRLSKELAQKDKAFDHRMKGKLEPMQKQLERLTNRNEELELMSQDLDRLKAQLQVKEVELKDRVQEISFSEKKLQKKQEMLLAERRKMQEELERAQERAAMAAATGGGGDSEQLLLMKEKMQEYERKLKEKEAFLQRKEAALAGDIDIGEVEIDTSATRCKTGIFRLDELTKGGLPFKSNFMIYGPPFSGKDIMAKLFIADGLKKGVPAMFVLTDKTPQEIRESFTGVVSNFAGYEAKGLIKYIDIYSKSMQIEEEDPNTIYIDKVTDLDEIGLAISNVQKEWQGKYPYNKMIFWSVTTMISYNEVMPTFQFLQNITARCKRAGTVAYYLMDSGMRKDEEIQTLKHVMTGVTEMRYDGAKYYLKVEGNIEVMSKAWIEYEFNQPKDFELKGAFSVDHIR